MILKCFQELLIKRYKQFKIFFKIPTSLIFIVLSGYIDHKYIPIPTYIYIYIYYIKSMCVNNSSIFLKLECQIIKNNSFFRFTVIAYYCCSSVVIKRVASLSKEILTVILKQIRCLSFGISRQLYNLQPKLEVV